MTQEKEARTLFELIRPRATFLEYLEVREIPTGEEPPLDQTKYENSAKLETVDEAHCEYIVESLVLLNTDVPYQIHVRMRAIFTMLEPVERFELENRIDEIETTLFSPVSLITGFVTEQMGLVPLIMPPLRKFHEE